MNEFGQKGKVPLSERLSVLPEGGKRPHRDRADFPSRGDQQRRPQGQEAREAYDHLPDNLRVWLNTLPDARRPIEESPFYFSAVLRSYLTVGRSGK
jgi:hypothetical protein